MPICINPSKCEFDDFKKTGAHFCSRVICRYSQEQIIERLTTKINTFPISEWANGNRELKWLMAMKQIHESGG